MLSVSPPSPSIAASCSAFGHQVGGVRETLETGAALCCLWSCPFHLPCKDPLASVLQRSGVGGSVGRSLGQLLSQRAGHKRLLFLSVLGQIYSSAHLREMRSILMLTPASSSQISSCVLIFLGLVFFERCVLFIVKRDAISCSPFSCFILSWEVG